MIRAVGPQDRALFLEFMRLFYASEAVLHPTPTVYHERTFDEVVSDSPYMAAYIAECDGKPAGYILTATTFSPEAGGLVVWVEEIYVLAEYRGRGIGRQLLRYVEQHRDAAVARLRLEVEPDNLKARHLYESLGYTALPYDQMVKDFPRM